MGPRHKQVKEVNKTKHSELLALLKFEDLRKVEADLVVSLKVT